MHLIGWEQISQWKTLTKSLMKFPLASHQGHMSIKGQGKKSLFQKLGNNCPNKRFLSGTVRAPVFGRHQFFGTSEHYGKAHGSLLSGWMNYNYTACCWFPTSSNILILPSQFWQIRFESCWLHCSKCRILVLLQYRGCMWPWRDGFTLNFLSQSFGECPRHHLATNNYDLSEIFGCL